MTSASATPVSSRLQSQALLGVLIALLLSEIALVWSAHPFVAWISRAAFLCLCCVGLSRFSIREASLMLFACVASIVAFRAGGLPVLYSGLDLAAFFGAFIAALTVMREIAARSRAIRAVGEYLIRQPAGRRYFSTALGGHVLGVFLNFGAVSLMSPLIQNAARHPDGRVDTALERRQLNALIRGFAWVLMWAPTTLTQAVLLTLFTDVTWQDTLPLGLATGLCFILLGRLYERYEWRGVPRPDGAVLPVPQMALLSVAMICTGLIGVTLLLAGLFEKTIAQSLMVVAPLVTLVWYLAQRWAAAHAEPLTRIFVGAAPGLARSAVALGLSGYIGRTLGRSLPMETLSQWVDLTHVPGWLFLACLPLLITLGGQAALSPILVVVLLGEALRGFEVLPTGQAQIVFALSVGWGLSMMTAPNATATLLISSVTRIPPTTLTWVWNLRFGALCYLGAVGVFLLIA